MHLYDLIHRTVKTGEVLLRHNHAPLDRNKANKFYVTWTDTQIVVGTEWDKTNNEFLR